MGLMEGTMRFLILLLLFVAYSGQAIAQSGALQPGDPINISVYQDPKLDRTVIVGPNGMISFPLAGPIRAGGLTPAQLENVLKQRLKGRFTEEPDVTVTLVAIRSPEEDLKPRFYITGEILRPGYYVMRTNLDLMQAIAMAGGFSPFAATRRIQVRRNINGAESTFVFNYNDFFSGTNLADNVGLRAGDVVIVPEKGLFE
jgi:polysaccharide export outer membrane protein